MRTKIKEKDSWGTVVGTGAHSIDEVVKSFAIGREFGEEEIRDGIESRGLKPRGAIREHMNTLVGRGHVAKTANGWKRMTG